MKIAILSSIAWRTPPRNYGPWEQVTSDLAEGLVASGIDVTLFATSDSLTNAKLEATCIVPYAENPDVDPKVVECLHISNAMEKASEFDLIHNHFDFLPLTYSGLIKTPVLTTIHGFSSDKIKEVYRKYNKHAHYVSISNADRDQDLEYTATVYNGIDPGAFPFTSIPDDYLLFFGRIHPDKGTSEAIEIARKSNRRLLIAGLIQDEAYFQREVEPHIDGEKVVYCGNVGPETRSTLLGMAFAMLHPINFEEPFGLSVAESMMCGTPVIAFSRGSMPELIQDGKTGYLVRSVDAAVEAVALIPAINRKDCADWAQSMFSRNSMVKGYLDVYEKILRG
jgi:glycosyltransferase involved in cell wall biosynthesis